MSNTTTIQAGGLVTFAVKINGSMISDYIQVLSIEIDTKVNEISHASIKLLDGDPSAGDFSISSSKTFVPGNEITIEAGYESVNTTLFKGIITGQSISITDREGSTLIVDCYDQAIKMTIGEKSKIYSQKTDSAIITSIVGEYSGLSSDIVTTVTTWPEIHQSQTTDWDFIRYRAEANGCVVSTKDNKVNVLRPEANTSSVLEVAYGNNLLNFKGTLNAINQLDTYTTETWNETSKTMIKGAANNAYAGPGNLSVKTLSKVLNQKVSTIISTSLQKPELEELSKAQLLKSAFSKIKGALEVQGTALVSPGMYITLNGLGDRFNGDHFVSSVRHTIENGNWITEITVGMDVIWVVPKVNRIGSINKNVQGI